MKAKPFIVGIAGGTGAGKTLLARAIASCIDSKDVILIQHDSYYKDRSGLSLSKREKLNYDHPDALDSELLIQHLKELIAGKPVEIPVYDFATHCRDVKGLLVTPAKVIILEGILLLSNANLCKLMDVKIFVDGNPDIRFIRRLQRDTMERGRTTDSVIGQYIETARPMHDKYVEPSKQYADIIIPNPKNNMAIDAIVNLIKRKAIDVE
jgi:uridine kinase